MLARRTRALRGSARSTRTVMSQVARSTTGGAAWARRTGMTAVRKRTGMTAASKRTGASSVGFFNNCLADDLGSMSTVPFGCLLLSLPIRAAHGVPFWRGFLGIHFKSMYIDFLSSHRNCVQLSQPVLAYATASLLPPCPRSHSSPPLVSPGGDISRLSGHGKSVTFTWAHAWEIKMD